jgi:hypothetical protein
MPRNWRTEWDCWDRHGPRPFGPDAPERASSKIAPGNFVEPARLMFVGSNPTHQEGGGRTPEPGRLTIGKRLVADRVGFEPTNTREDVTGFPIQRLRPLGHLSVQSLTLIHWRRH